MKTPEYWLNEAWSQMQGGITAKSLHGLAFELWRSYWHNRIWYWSERLKKSRGDDWLIERIDDVHERMRGTIIDYWGKPGQDHYHPPYEKLKPNQRTMLVNEISWTICTLASLKLKKRYPAPTIEQAQSFVDEKHGAQLILAGFE